MFRYDNNSDFSSPVYTSATLTTTSHTPPAMTAGVYYWQVRARDLAGNWSVYSTARTIIIDTTPPPVPVLSNPANGAATTNTQPTFAWGAPSGATGYMFRYDNNSDFSSPVYTSTTLTTTSHTPPAMTAGVYYWQVQARDEAGNWSAYSTARTIIIK
jgi:hypothetical protein